MANEDNNNVRTELMQNEYSGKAPERTGWERLDSGCHEMGIQLDEQQLSQFRLYYEHLVKVNEVMNLTAITSLDEVVLKHFLDSLSLVRVLDPTKVQSVIDVGTGAGFPGIPLKIAFPHLKLTLADSLNKRVRFLNEVTEICGLQDVCTVHARAEELGHDAAHRGKYDLCVSRAVASLPSLCEYCLPFVRLNGQFISYKSAEIQEELQSAGKAIRILGGGKPSYNIFTLPESDLRRSLVIIKKTAPTPEKYPRKPGIPAKTPLK